MVDFFHFGLLEKHKALIHAVTMKNGVYPFGFSLALHTGEEPEKIIFNRERLSKILDPKHQMYFVLARQTHSKNIRIVSCKENRGWQSYEDAIIDCDALITDQKGVMLGILTADCVPVLLYDPHSEIIGAIHAGWKGSRAEIVRKTVERMGEVYGTDPADIIAGVGPSIGKCCYEVGEDVAKYFSHPDDVCGRKGEKYMLDLPAINRNQLLSAGVRSERIDMSGICTACEVDRFFSYRKESGCSGRFMSLIGMHQI